jgi:hypothetical protein
MAVRYFCDNCGGETRPGELAVMVISVPPEAETFEVCPACVDHMTRELERCRTAKGARDVAVARPRAPVRRDVGQVDRWGGAVALYRSLSDLPGVRPLARAASYGAIFVVFFVTITLLTTLR